MQQRNILHNTSQKSRRKTLYPSVEHGIQALKGRCVKGGNGMPGGVLGRRARLPNQLLATIRHDGRQ